MIPKMEDLYHATGNLTAMSQKIEKLAEPLNREEQRLLYSMWQAWYNAKVVSGEFSGCGLP